MDIRTDTSHRHFVNIASIVGQDNIPLYARQYDIPDEKIASSFDDSAFADRDNREYSLESPGATWLSAAYLAYNNKGNIPDSEIAGNIKRAAEVYGITKDVSKAVRTIREHFEKMATPKEPTDADYGLVIYDQAGTKKRKYPMFCAEDVSKAASYFEDNRKAYPAKVRKVITTRILQKAAEFSVSEDELPECIFKEAGLCIPDRESIIDELENRAAMVKDAEVATLVANTAKLVRAAPAEELPEVMDKVAGTIEACDIVDGRVQQYGRNYMFPADVIYGMPYKQASEMARRVVVLGGNAFDAVKMAAEITAEQFGGILGDGFATSIVVNGTIDPMRLADGLNKLASVQKDELANLLLDMFA
jgi:hypothetical protein